MILRAAIIAVFVIALAITGCAHVGTVFEDGSDTVAHWTFEEGTVDRVATGEGSILDLVGGHHGTPFNGPTYRSAVTPNGGPLGLGFDTLNERVFVPDHADLALTGSLTLEAVVIRNPGKAWLSYIVFRGDDRNGHDPYSLHIKQDGHVGFHVAGANGVPSTLRSPGPLVAGQLTHVAGTFDDATGHQKLFVNGVLVDKSVTLIRPYASLDSTRNPGVGIGNTQSDSYPEAFPGIIVEVRISDIALEPDQFISDPAALSP